MKINDVGGNGGTKPAEVQSSRAGKQAKPAAPERAERDRIEVSDGAKRLAALTDAANRLPEIRPQLVEALRKSIEDGSYRVDPRALARAILEFEDGPIG